MAADNGNLESIRMIANMLFFGKVIEQNKRKAFHYSKMAADLGDDDSMYDCYIFLIKGDEIEKNEEEAIKYLKKAAEKENTSAMFKYADYLFDSNQDLGEATRYIKKAIDNGCINAISYYGIVLMNGDGIEVNYKDAAKYLQKGIELNDEASMFYYQILILKDENESILRKKDAIKTIKSMSDNGYDEVMFEYGTFCDEGDLSELGVRIDKAKAAYYYKKSADLGNPKSMNNYGSMLRNGLGVPMNKEEGIKYIEMAARKYNCDAMYNYGGMITDGILTDKDKMEGMKYLKESSKMGDNEAKFALGKQLLADGDDSNKEEAINYIKESADNGCELAVYQYALILFRGDIVEQDQKKVAYYFIKAAD
ncbi:hypothetical protein M9Y10_006334 [Tritrichomonas musculus]|uniref:Sel1 repeat protein n=1 Tax=Tritrichomonas musculus TaxID=1915356 RepID=A0ABR2JGH0_9EUKA